MKTKVNPHRIMFFTLAAQLVIMGAAAAAYSAPSFSLGAEQWLVLAFALFIILAIALWAANKPFTNV